MSTSAFGIVHKAEPPKARYDKQYNKKTGDYIETDTSKPLMGTDSPYVGMGERRPIKGKAKLIYTDYRGTDVKRKYKNPTKKDALILANKGIRQSKDYHHVYVDSARTDPQGMAHARGLRFDTQMRIRRARERGVPSYVLSMGS